MKQLLILCLVGFATTLFAQQDTIVTIQQIQFVPVDSLVNCDDRPNFENDTVITHGTVVMAGDISTLAGGHNIWIQSGTGPFSGIEIFGDAGTVPIPNAGTSILDLLPGDSIEIRGIVIDFDHTTEILPLEITVVDFGKPVKANPVDPADINDANRINQPATGEEWEGAYVELYNVTAGPPIPFSNNTRSSFNVSDGDGNLINISPRFEVMSLPATGGTFVEFADGTVFDTIRGVLRHSPNGVCQGTGRGYEIYPFQESDFVVQAGSAPPQITSSRNPIDPSSSEDVNVFATITDPDGTVSSAELHYAVGLNNSNYLVVPMSASGSTYTGTIPSTAYSDGDFVKYYICATDNDYLSQCTPNVPNGNTNPLFFVAKDTGLTIYDIQFTPYDDGISGYVGLDVTVTGVVTASAQANDLGFVYIQQPGVTQWGGISLVEGTLTSLERGDMIEVSGVVENYFGLNRLSVTGQPNKISSGNPLPDPVELDPSDFTSYDFALTEPYEGMLVKFVNPSGAGIYVVDTNPDSPNNFAEYRVGTNQFDPLIGCRIQAGRKQNSNFSSLDFSYVNDSSWLTADGQMNVPACIVTGSDTMESVTGIMYYGFGMNKLLPRNNADAVNYSGANCKDGIASAITDAWAGSSLTVYPNPVFDQLTIEFDLPFVVEGHIELVDLVGRTVHHEQFKAMSGKTVIQTADLAQGTYFLRVRTASEVIGYEKVVLMK